MMPGLLLIVVSGCAVHQQVPTGQLAGIDGIACRGAITVPVVGLTAIDDPQLIQSALGKSGEGKLCAGRVYQVTAPLTVYRVWNRSKSYSLYGRWWSLTRPTGPRAKYRKANDICPSWSELNEMIACTVIPGSRLVIGPGQSLTCKDMTLPASPVNQVYIPNDSRNNILHVENCTEGEAMT